MQTKQQQKAAAAAMAVVGDDELTLLDFFGENPPRKASEKIGADSFLFEEILDPSVDAIPGLSPPKNSPEEELNDELNGEEEEELEWLLNKDAFPSLETSFDITSAASPVSVLPLKVPVKARSKTGRKKRRTFATISANKRRCRHCEAEETPQWRTGPDGPKTLCNACGVRFRKGRLVPEYRPINSPTFLAELHSNSHRRIVGMRKKKGEEDDEEEEEKPKKGRRGRPPKSMVVM